MKYALLIYDTEGVGPQEGTAEFETMMAGFNALGAEMDAAGARLGGHALQPVATATTVRVRDGKVATTDGPFAETKEQFGGLYVVEAENLDDALGYAAKIPSAAWGSVEVRPIWEIPGD